MFNAQNFFSPKPSDREYALPEDFRVGLICRMDSYKFSHPFAYPSGIEGMTNYGTARIGSDKSVVAAGMQILVKKYLTQRITMADIDLAEEFSRKHFGQHLFARSDWEKVVNQYNGYLPLIIRAVPEGTRVSGGCPIYTVTVLDSDLFWMGAAFETLIQRAVWYPTTIATNDYETKRHILHYYEMSGADMGMLPFALHDFGARGCASSEQAEIGGAIHTFNFMGSDTVEGVLTANHYYKSDMAAYSVYATEHSVECSFGGGKTDAIEYIRHQITQAKRMGLPIVSIVLDGYDVYREAEICCTELKDVIVNSGVKVVFRPDSGDMMEVVPKILKMQARAFGTTTTNRGFLKINHVGIIQGDGVDRASIGALLGKVVGVMRFSADSVLFGSGGALLQKVNRDTYKFAQKASAILKTGKWVGIAKNPITDSGKRSLEGVLTTVMNDHGDTIVVRVDTDPIPDGYTDAMQLVYHCGVLYNETTLDEIRDRLK